MSDDDIDVTCWCHCGGPADPDSQRKNCDCSCHKYRKVCPRCNGHGLYKPWRVGETSKRCFECSQTGFVYPDDVNVSHVENMGQGESNE